jgi:hypothetical protein
VVEGRKEGRGGRREGGRKEGRNEGMKERRKEVSNEGREEGRKEGRKEGREEGMEEGRSEGSMIWPLDFPFKLQQDRRLLLQTGLHEWSVCQRFVICGYFSRRGNGALVYQYGPLSSSHQPSVNMTHVN